MELLDELDRLSKPAMKRLAAQAIASSRECSKEMQIATHLLLVLLGKHSGEERPTRMEVTLTQEDLARVASTRWSCERVALPDGSLRVVALMEAPFPVLPVSPPEDVVPAAVEE